MRRLILVAAIFGSIGGGIFGCSGDVPKVETYDVSTPDPLNEAKSVLGNYAKGMPVASEAETFANLAARVKEKDASKGAVLEKGLMEIKANPASAKAKATELLKQL